MCQRTHTHTHISAEPLQGLTNKPQPNQGMHTWRAIKTRALLLTHASEMDNPAYLWQCVALKRQCVLLSVTKQAPPTLLAMRSLSI